MNKISVWGSYLWGNFGDDVMGLMVCLRLKSLGYSPVIFKLDQLLADRYGVETTDKLDHLFVGTSALVIGGGGLLCGGNLMDSEWAALEAALISQELPIHIFSIGGDGIDADPHVSASACRVMGSRLVRSATVRLSTDISALRLISPALERIHCFPDVLLTAPEFFEPLPCTQEKPLSSEPMIINTGKSRAVTVLDSIQVHAAPVLPRPILFAATHLEHLRRSKGPVRLDYEYQSKSTAQNIAYHNINQMASVVSSASSVVSGKLHLGVFALAYGTPFISINGATKTIAFMKQAGLESSILAINRLLSLRLPCLVLARHVDALAARASSCIPVVASLKRESHGHWNELGLFLQTL